MAVLVISYARPDRPQVRGLVSLLSTALRGIEQAVFWDEDFEPGEPWFKQMKKHIDAAPQLFVCWCEHSARSRWVRREFLYARTARKRVIPVLFDDAPLPAELSAIHGIDLRNVVRHQRSVPAETRRSQALNFADSGIVEMLREILELSTDTAKNIPLVMANDQSDRVPPLRGQGWSPTEKEALRQLENAIRRFAKESGVPNTLPALRLF
ncbi:MAG: toll/interleukin-1 receptor domain-containing protein [Dehalococcoidia bacterium]